MIEVKVTRDLPGWYRFLIWLKIILVVIQAIATGVAIYYINQASNNIEKLNQVQNPK